METNKISQIAKDAALNSFYGNLEVISKWSRSTFMDNASWIKTYMKPNIDILSEVLPDYFISEENEILKARCETYKKDYDSMVAEVLRLSGENSELLEALKSTRSLNLSLHEQDTVGNRVYKKVESAITKATK